MPEIIDPNNVIYRGDEGSYDRGCDACGNNIAPDRPRYRGRVNGNYVVYHTHCRHWPGVTIVDGHVRI